MSVNALMACYANPMRVVDAADFDGTNDYMLKTTEFTGLSDSKKGIISIWIRKDGGDATAMRIFSNANGASSSTRCEVTHNGSSFGTDNTFAIKLRNSSAYDDTANILYMETLNTYTAGASWIHILASWDLATSAYYLYINGTSDINTGNDLIVDDTIDYTLGRWAVGASGNGSFKLDSCLAELYFAPGQYLDISIASNRRKFISASGKPVHLGTDGSLPTGTAPIVYLHLDDGDAVANFATNRGTGGDFTITGTLDTASTSPSD